MKKIIISLGGSLICPEKLDVVFIRKFKELIEDYTKKDFLFFIVCGGGKLCRDYQNSANELRKLSNEESDWLGITATKLNAQFIKSIFKEDLVFDEVIDNPQVAINTKKKIIIGSGYKPGCSTDHDAVLLAQKQNTDTIINMSNITHVYDRDPKTNTKAKKLEMISWKVYREIISDTWSPGLNTPFDPTASKKAESLGLKTYIIGSDLDNLKNIFDDKEFVGTAIS
ncbi:UMP kinase [Candidatus Pacearchaeota archaeon]|nr:UMP kinase [Candidatus Pacearchaeota archaeon]